MDMVNQLGKFFPGLADINASSRQLLRKDSVWYWDEAQRTAFQRVKEKLASTEILAHYNRNCQTVIAADASSTGLGAVLPQTQDTIHLRRPWTSSFFGPLHGPSVLICGSKIHVT